jgi:hypothetical protein
MAMGPVELATKNHCAGEDQQQISSQSLKNGRISASDKKLRFQDQGVT